MSSERPNATIEEERKAAENAKAILGRLTPSISSHRTVRTPKSIVPANSVTARGDGIAAPRANNAKNTPLD
jgi:hypothetical protein